LSILFDCGFWCDGEKALLTLLSISTIILTGEDGEAKNHRMARKKRLGSSSSSSSSSNNNQDHAGEENENQQSVKPMKAAPVPLCVVSPADAPEGVTESVPLDSNDICAPNDLARLLTFFYFGPEAISESKRNLDPYLPLAWRMNAVESHLESMASPLNPLHPENVFGLENAMRFGAAALACPEQRSLFLYQDWATQSMLENGQHLYLFPFPTSCFSTCNVTFLEKQWGDLRFVDFYGPRLPAKRSDISVFPSYSRSFEPIDPPLPSSKGRVEDGSFLPEEASLDCPSSEQAALLHHHQEDGESHHHHDYDDDDDEATAASGLPPDHPSFLFSIEEKTAKEIPFLTNERILELESGQGLFHDLIESMTTSTDDGRADAIEDVLNGNAAFPHVVSDETDPLTESLLQAAREFRENNNLSESHQVGLGGGNLSSSSPSSHWERRTAGNNNNKKRIQNQREMERDASSRVSTTLMQSELNVQHLSDEIVSFVLSRSRPLQLRPINIAMLDRLAKSYQQRLLLLTQGDGGRSSNLKKSLSLQKDLIKETLKIKARMAKSFWDELAQCRNLMGQKEPWSKPVRSMVKWYFDLQPRQRWSEDVTPYSDLSDYGNMRVIIETRYRMCWVLKEGDPSRSLYLLTMCRDNALASDFGQHLNFIADGEASSGKSYIFKCLEQVSVPGSIVPITHITAKAYTTETATNDFHEALVITHEMPNIMLGIDDDGRPVPGDPILKNRLTSNMVATKRFAHDPLTGQSITETSFSLCRSTTIGATNAELPPIESPVTSRFIRQQVTPSFSEYGTHELMMATLPGTAASLDSASRLERAANKEKLAHFFVMVAERAIEAGIIKDVDCHVIEVHLLRVLNRLNERFHIPKPVPRRIEFITKLARSIALRSAIHQVYFSEAGATLRARPDILSQGYDKDDDDGTENHAALESCSSLNQTDGRKPSRKKQRFVLRAQEFDPVSLLEVERRAVCTEEVLADALSLLEVNIIPVHENRIISAIKTILDKRPQGQRIYRTISRNVNRIVHSVTDLNYCQLAHTNLNSFVADIVLTLGENIKYRERIVKDIVRSLKDRLVPVTEANTHTINEANPFEENVVAGNDPLGSPRLSRNSTDAHQEPPPHHHHQKNDREKDDPYADSFYQMASLGGKGSILKLPIFRFEEGNTGTAAHHPERSCTISVLKQFFENHDPSANPLLESIRDVLSHPDAVERDIITSFTHRSFEAYDPESINMRFYDDDDLVRIVKPRLDPPKKSLAKQVVAYNKRIMDDTSGKGLYVDEIALGIQSTDDPFLGYEHDGIGSDLDWLRTKYVEWASKTPAHFFGFPSETSHRRHHHHHSYSEEEEEEEEDPIQTTTTTTTTTPHKTLIQECPNYQTYLNHIRHHIATLYKSPVRRLPTYAKLGIPVRERDYPSILEKIHIRPNPYAQFIHVRNPLSESYLSTLDALSGTTTLSDKGFEEKKKNKSLLHKEEEETSSSHENKSSDRTHPFSSSSSSSDHAFGTPSLEDETIDLDDENARHDWPSDENPFPHRNEKTRNNPQGDGDESLNNGFDEEEDEEEEEGGSESFFSQQMEMSFYGTASREGVLQNLEKRGKIAPPLRFIRGDVDRTAFYKRCQSIRSPFDEWLVPTQFIQLCCGVREALPHRYRGLPIAKDYVGSIKDEIRNRRANEERTRALASYSLTRKCPRPPSAQDLQKSLGDCVVMEPPRMRLPVPPRASPLSRLVRGIGNHHPSTDCSWMTKHQQQQQVEHTTTTTNETASLLARMSSMGAYRTALRPRTAATFDDPSFSTPPSTPCDENGQAKTSSTSSSPSACQKNVLDNPKRHQRNKGKEPSSSSSSSQCTTGSPASDMQRLRRLVQGDHSSSVLGQENKDSVENDF